MNSPAHSLSRLKTDWFGWVRPIREAIDQGLLQADRPIAQLV